MRKMSASYFLRRRRLYAFNPSQEMSYVYGARPATALANCGLKQSAVYSTLMSGLTMFSSYKPGVDFAERYTFEGVFYDINVARCV